MEKKGRLLVIDDEIGICEGIQRALEMEGFLVEFSLDGMSGINKIKEDDFDVVLLDVKMPKISGLDLISLIHEINPEIICIMITGYATVEMAVTAIKRGAYDFLTKPFSVDVLLLAVNQGLERKMLSSEAKRTVRMELEARELAEEKTRLEKLDQAKRQFIRLVTHELKSPVSAVENYLKLILQGYISPENQTEILEKCIERTREERKLIDDLLELGKLEVIESFPVVPVHPDKILKDVINEFREEINQQGHNLELEVDEDIPEISAVPEHIKYIWCKLISNEVKYTPSGGKIYISLKVEGESLIGLIRDTGIGIYPEDQKNLFTEFFRAKNAKETGASGTGLGLVIAKRIIDGLGGTISVESKVGFGSSFKISIPLNTS